MQGRPKGGKKKFYTKEEKIKILEMILNVKTSWDIEREYKINHSVSSNWLKKYIESGIDGLKNKKKPGNPLVKYSMRKSLTPLEELEYENMKLKIENERLKKGYMLKVDGSVVMFKK